MKTCWCCKEEKSSEDFYAGQSRCKACSNKLRVPRRKMCSRGCMCSPCEEQRKIDRENVASRPSQSSTARRARRRGMTVEQVEQMHAVRDDKCDICGKEETVKGSNGKVKSLAIDHNAETGYVRGLLCSNCNRALGLLAHDPERVQRAADHLLGEWL